MKYLSSVGIIIIKVSYLLHEILELRRQYAHFAITQSELTEVVRTPHIELQSIFNVDMCKDQ
jgi:hypothetical protein